MVQFHKEALVSFIPNASLARLLLIIHDEEPYKSADFCRKLEFTYSEMTEWVCNMTYFRCWNIYWSSITFINMHNSFDGQHLMKKTFEKELTNSDQIIPWKRQCERNKQMKKKILHISTFKLQWVFFSLLSIKSSDKLVQYVTT